MPIGRLRSLSKSAYGWLARVYDHPYNRARPLSALKRLGQWHVLRQLGVPQDLSFWGTRTIRCFPDADGSMWLILNVVMDWQEFHFMRRYLRPSDIFLDIGANLGIYTLWASQFVTAQGRIVAFEPDPENLARLRTQLALNALERIEVAAVALSNSIGKARFSQGGDMVNHVVIETSEAPFIEVPCTTLDAYASEHSIGRVSFAKIDVEGAEQLVLRGATLMLQDQRIDVIQLEFNAQVVGRGLPTAEVERILVSNGYALYRFDPTHNRLSSVPEVDLSHHENLFAIHDLASVEARLAERAHEAA